MKDEKLWKEAKKLAGEEGLSAVIANALSSFVEEKRRTNDGFKRYRVAVDLEPVGENWSEGEPRHRDRIAFEGLPIVETKRFEVEEVDEWGASEVAISVYRTRAGTLVLTADTAGGIGDLVSEPAVTHWANYKTLRELQNDRIVKELNAADRAQLLDKVAAAVGEDWATWIE